MLLWPPRLTLFKFCKYLCLEKTNPSWQFVDVLCSSLMMQCNRLFLQCWFYVKNHIVKNIKQLLLFKEKTSLLKITQYSLWEFPCFTDHKGQKAEMAIEAHSKLCKKHLLQWPGNILMVIPIMEQDQQACVIVSL